MTSQKDTRNTSLQSSYYFPKTPRIDGIIYLPGITREFLKGVKNLPVKGDEVFVATYPRSGTTWTCEVVWQTFMNGRQDMTFIKHRVPMVESLITFNNITTTEQLFNFVSEKRFPRLFKTHLQYHLAPMGDGGDTRPKYINVIRNPKDCAVSFYHHTKNFLWNGFDGSWADFFEIFMRGEVKFGSWFDHVLGWWAHRDDPNVLVLRYEDMKKDLHTAIKQIAKFIGRDVSEDTIQLIAKQTSFEAMSTGDGRFFDGDQIIEEAKRQDATKWLRKGQVGDWKNYFTDEQNRRFYELYETKMAGSGLELEFS